MEVILLKKVDNLGDLGDQVKVRAGYGRNFLLPTGRAVSATPDNVKVFEERRAELEKAEADLLAVAQERKAAIEAVAEITLAHQVGEEGKLFGSVGTHDIADAVSAAGAQLEKSEVRLPEGPLRIAGEHEVALHLHSEVNAAIKVIIVPEE